MSFALMNLFLPHFWRAIYRMSRVLGSVRREHSIDSVCIWGNSRPSLPIYRPSYILGQYIVFQLHGTAVCENAIFSWWKADKLDWEMLLNTGILISWHSDIILRWLMVFCYFCRSIRLSRDNQSSTVPASLLGARDLIAHLMRFLLPLMCQRHS